VGPRAGLDGVAKTKEFHNCLRRELNPDRPTHSIVTKLTELSQFDLILGTVYVLVRVRCLPPPPPPKCILVSCISVRLP
jgi:hypothetical protein